MKIQFEVFDPLETTPKVKKHMLYVDVLILLKGENEFCEALFSEEGFSSGYDEPLIKDQVCLWSYLPKKPQQIT